MTQTKKPIRVAEVNIKLRQLQQAIEKAKCKAQKELEQPDDSTCSECR